MEIEQAYDTKLQEREPADDEIHCEGIRHLAGYGTDRDLGTAQAGTMNEVQRERDYLTENLDYRKARISEIVSCLQCRRHMFY